MSKTNEKRTIKPDDLFSLKFLRGAKLSPDGKMVVYGIAQTDIEKEEETVALWVQSIEGGEPRQLTSGKAVDSSPNWSPDSNKIAFLSTREGSPQVYVIPVDGGEAKALTSLPQPIGEGPVYSPDGKYIAFTASKPMDAPPDPAKPYRVTRHTYRFDAAGYLANVVQDIYVIPADGGEVKQLTDDDTQNMGLIWSPDGQEILYNAAFQPDSFDIFNYNLRLVNMDGKVREIVKKHGMIRSKGWTADSKHILFVSTIPTSSIGTKSDLWIMRRHGGKPQNRTADLKYHAGGGLQGDTPEDFGMMSTLYTSRDGTKAYVPVQQGGSVQIYEVALTGDNEWTPILDGDRTVNLLGKSDDHLFFSVNTLDKPSDLFISDLDGKNEVQLTHINDDVLAKLSLPSVENLLFKGSDGEQVEGWIMKPVGGEAPYPTVLYIHGGPHGAFGHTFSFDFQMLAGAGYAILIINQRASTGYGNKFAAQIKGDWGNLDYKDLMAGVDHAIEKGLADPDRLGVCGLSGGGNLSCWIVGQTDRFKAAVPENPITNWFSFYGISDIGPHFSEEELGGKPQEIPEVYTRCSPITYAHNCTTPTLLIQGESDYRCPAEQSEQFYAVLKANGCVVEMLRLPNSPHAGSIRGAVPIRKAQNEALLDWMNRYVMGVTSEK